MPRLGLIKERLDLITAILLFRAHPGCLSSVGPMIRKYISVPRILNFRYKAHFSGPGVICGLRDYTSMTFARVEGSPEKRTVML